MSEERWNIHPVKEEITFEQRNKQSHISPTWSKKSKWTKNGLICYSRDIAYTLKIYLGLVWGQ